MKKLKLLIFLLITILILPGKAYAAFPDAYPLGLSQEYIWQRTGDGLDGFPDETGTIYTYDYREFSMHPKRSALEKPTAQFAVHVNGQEKARSDAGYDLDAPTVVCDVNIDDKIEIVDHSKPYGNYTLNKWDFQYRIVPVDDSVNLSDIDDYRNNFLIKASIFASKTGPNKHFQQVIWKEARELYPDRNFYIELYMQVHDINYKDGSYAGGENGTYACIREKDFTPPSEFEKGNTWYFTTVMLRVNTQGTPDFFPTPEGSNEWQISFRDPHQCAKTYIGQPGEIINIPVSLHNAGEKETTDFAATWFGSSSGSDPRSYGFIRPLWKEENITLDKGEKRDFIIPVKVPDMGQETRLVFLANVDGKTPGTEVNQENNMMIIKIQEAGVDIEAKLPDQPQIYLIDPGQTANVFVPLIVRRNDDGTKPVDTDINYSGPFGSVDKQATFTSMNSNYYDIKFSLTQPGKYYVKASAWPVGVTDIKPENNEDQCLIVVKLKEPPKTQPTKTDSDSNTRVNLRS